MEALAKEDPEKARQLLDAAEAELRKAERRIADGRKAVDKSAPTLPSPRAEVSTEDVTDADIVEDGTSAPANT
ncbi:hypothetical protein Snoj_29380 [Streptomyces nojiriensis]|uniref:Uncharacterized protein n=1 Tax=Streptomyces nojiriensis TaxID=66374 RepID=A0ABQ3SLK9_9ACTN|nr:hypothetical protein GCM10010205_77500 [Streptomyces nojiriensis]GHI69020.1 hypothetical protein Snoj_29380 [Streptomyces nojiriensis]